MTLPAKYAVRDYLRKQGQRQEKLSSDITDALLKRFHSAYERHRVKAGELKSFAEEYGSYLSDGGCFALQTTYTAPTKASPYREHSSVNGYAVEPVSLGQGWPSANIYTENAALVRCHVGEFRRKKAFLAEGYCGVALTQHVLERVYERTEIHWSDFPALIERELIALLRALAIANLCDFWLRDTSRGSGYIFTAVPYSNGLLLANMRIVHGNYAEGDFGFRVRIPSGIIETPFVNNDLILEDLLDGQFLKGDNRPILTICGVTYFNCMTLNKNESDYYHGYCVLMEELGEALLDLFAYCQFAPTMAHERHPDFDIRQRYGTKIERLRALLQDGWLQPNPTNPICLLLPFDHRVPKLTV